MNRTKVLDDNLQTKNDEKDTLLLQGYWVVANLVIRIGIEAKLRVGARLRSKM